MRMRTVTVVLAILLVGLVSGWVSAQVYRPQPQAILTNPFVLSGADIGFQVEGSTRDSRLGTLVVRIDGKWVPFQIQGQHPELIH